MRKKLEREGGKKIRKNFGPVAGQVNEGDQFFKQLMRAMKKKKYKNIAGGMFIRKLSCF